MLINATPIVSDLAGEIMKRRHKTNAGGGTIIPPTRTENG